MNNLRLRLITPNLETETALPLASSGVSAGFPSPAEDHLDGTLDLNKALIRHPSATFFVRVEGESMKDDNINDGDLLIVDKAVELNSGDIAVCYIDGEFTLKRVVIDRKEIVLQPSNKQYKPIHISPYDDFTVWGVVTYSIKKH